MTTADEDEVNNSELPSTTRTEAFSDGVLAIALTLLVLNLAVPASEYNDLGSAVLRLWPAYVSFLASFVFIAVIWLNHHAAFKRGRSRRVANRRVSSARRRDRLCPRRRTWAARGPGHRTDPPLRAARVLRRFQ